MAASLALALAAITVYWIYSNVSSLLKNIAAAKRSGLPYVVARQYSTSSQILPLIHEAHRITAWIVYNIFWIVTHKLWLPILTSLSKIMD
jgi:hypothetical protein